MKKPNIIKIIFQARDTKLLSFWQQKFKNFSEVTFKQSSLPQQTNAVFERFIFPCNRYDIAIKRGESLVIDTSKYEESSFLIVTTPRLDNDLVSSQEERDYLEFKLAFEAITKHNQLKEEAPIETLLIDIQRLYSLRSHIPYNEVEGAYKAYKEYREN